MDEIALLKRFSYGARSKQRNVGQASLLEESVDADLAAIETELDALQAATPERKVRQHYQASNFSLPRYPSPKWIVLLSLPCYPTATKTSLLKASGADTPTVEVELA